MGKGSMDCSVRVAVRVRPLVPHELLERAAVCTKVHRDTRQLVIGMEGDGEKSFTFDFTFAQGTQQHEIYEDCVAPLVDAFFEGFNATILAYGQTGSGKTYTMGSASSARLSDEDQGILPRVIANMFDMIQSSKENSSVNISYIVKCQFLEIYGEDLKDLLDPAGTCVTVREGQNGEVNIHGAKEEQVSDAEGMLMLLERGSLCRTTGSTLMNAHSSRSHAIFTVLLEQRIGDEAGPGAEGTSSDDLEIRISKFHFVDLAGSERAKRTGASGQRFKEGIEINKGLLTLGNVISALGDDSKRGKVHVPYRDSKLTRMLQDSLGGNSQTLMICCVSPSETNISESTSALRYANRARNIQNKPIVNRDHNSAVIAELKAKVQMLASELLKVRTGDGDEEGGLSAHDLQALSVATTPRKGVAPPARPSSFGTTGTTSLVAQRELATWRARASEAESQVAILTEKLKDSKFSASAMADKLARVTAERDVLALGEEGLSELETAAAADESSVSAEEAGPSPEEGGLEKRKSLSEKLMGFLHKSGSSKDSKADEGELQQQEEEEVVARAVTGGKKKKLRGAALLQGLHARIEDLEAKLRKSEQSQKKTETRLLDSHREALVLEEAVSRRGSFTSMHGRRGSSGSLHRKTSRGSVGGFSSVLSGAARDAEELVERTAGRLQEEKLKRDKLKEEKRKREQLLMALSSDDDSGEKENRPESQVEDYDGKSKSSHPLLEELEEEGDGERDEEDDGDEEEQDDATAEAKAQQLLEQERAAKRREAKLASDLDELEKGIMLKEELLAQLQENQKYTDLMEKHYMVKLAEMDEAVKRMEGEQLQLLNELQEMETSTKTAVKAEREKLKAKLERQTAALREAKMKQKELSNMAASKKRDDSKLATLEGEIGKMKRIKVDLMKQLDRERKAQTQALQAKTKEISILRRGAQKDKAEIKALIQAKQRAEGVAKRHLEELSLLRRVQRAKMNQGRKQNFSDQERKVKQWITTQVRELSRHEEAGEVLAAEYERKLLLLQQKENLEMVKSSITSRADSLGEDERAHLEEVTENLEATLAQVKAKEQRIRKLEEEAKKAKGAMGRGGGEGFIIRELISKVRDIDSAHGVIKIIVNCLVSSRRLQKKRGEELRNMEQQIKDMSTALEDTQERSQAEVRRYDRKLMEVSKEYEDKMSGLMSHTAVSKLLLTPNKADDEPGGEATIDGEVQEAGEEEKALILISNERNLALRDAYKRVEARLRESEIRCGDAEEAMKTERKRRQESEQEGEWLKFELKAFRSRYRQLEGQWKELRTTHKELLDSVMDQGLPQPPGASSPVHGEAGVASVGSTSPAGGGHAPQAGNEADGHKGLGLGAGLEKFTPQVDAEAFGQALEVEHEEEEEEEEDFDEEIDFTGVTRDIEAIAQGRIPESMAMILTMDGQGGAKESVSVFERLANQDTESRRHKVNKEALSGEPAKRKAAKKSRDHREMHVYASNDNMPSPQASPSFDSQNSAASGQDTQHPDSATAAAARTATPSQDQDVFERLRDPRFFPKSAQEKMNPPLPPPESKPLASLVPPPAQPPEPAQLKKKRTSPRGSVFDRLQRNPTEAVLRRRADIASSEKSNNT
ncbi:unnamed protein product [Chrysoparadoxa australica]